MTAPHLTTGLMWTAALIAAIFDIFLLALVGRMVGRERFIRAKWPVAGLTTLFFGAVWTFAMWGSWWELAYQYVFPGWARWMVPPVYGPMFGAVALALWWLARRAPRLPGVAFCLLGGLVSLPGHMWAFYGRGMLEKVPLLRGVSDVSALVFGIFEFTAYFSLILLAASLVQRSRERRSS
jgi:hypothetical protein